MRNIVHKPLGGQILDVKIGDEQLFYLSPLSDLISTKSLRGGIPVLFPQFGNLGPLNKHGFVRDLNWKLLNDIYSVNGNFIEYELIINNVDNPRWRHDAKLNLIINLNKNVFSINFSVLNLGVSAFCFSGGLHPYFKISSRELIKINGIENFQFKDSFPGQNIFDLNGDSMIERLYLTNSEIHFFNGSSNLLIKTNGFQNWMLWNPGSHGAKFIGDLPDFDWDKFICIEPIIVDPIYLHPGEVFNGELTVEVLNY